MLNQQHAFPEQVNKPAPLAQGFDRGFKTCDLAAFDAEHIKEIVIKALGLAFFVMGIRPFTGKLGSAGADFVPGEHGGFVVTFKSS